jgi:quercetin dioxygenase-like cupin family protein
MSAVDTEKIAFWEGHPGSRMKVVGRGEKMTMVYARIKSGSDIPEHKHPQEQIAYCLQGEATFKIGDKTFLIEKGYSFLIPANTVHSGKVTSDEEYISVEAFSPPRTDLLRGEFKPEKAQW